jgi:hypothetical protein
LDENILIFVRCEMVNHVGKLGALLLLAISCPMMVSAGEGGMMKQGGKETAITIHGGSRFLFEGELAKIEMERSLYDLPGKDEFFVAFRITNLTDKPLGIDLSRYSSVLYPNQWGFSETLERRRIDERRIIPKALSADEQAKLFARFHAGELAMIEPRQVIVYYRDFNGPGRDQFVKDRILGTYVIISIDGQLRITDGKRVEDFHYDPHIPSEPSDVVLRREWPFQPLPPRGWILMNDVLWDQSVEDWTVSLIARRGSWKAGGPVLVNAVLKNVGRTAGRAVAQAGWALYQFSIRRGDKEIPLSNKGRQLMEGAREGSTALLDLQPGQVQLASFDLSEAFDLSAPGTYRVNAARQVWKRNRPGEWATVQSNELVLEIEQRE